MVTANDPKSRTTRMSRRAFLSILSGGLAAGIAAFQGLRRPTKGWSKAPCGYGVQTRTNAVQLKACRSSWGLLPAAVFDTPLRSILAYRINEAGGLAFVTDVTPGSIAPS